jgi:hypothetical protein
MAAEAWPGVLVLIVKADHRITVRTSDNGAFVGEELPTGEYEGSIDAVTLPAGYPVNTLMAHRVRV